MRKSNHNRILNIAIITFLALAVLGFLTSSVFSAGFVEKYIDEDQRIGEHVKTRVDLFQTQMFYLSLFIGLSGLLILIFKMNILRFLRNHPEFLTNILFLLILLVVLFAVGETAMRLFFSEMVYKEYGHGPGVYKLSEKIESNLLGYKDVEHSLAKDEGVYRVLFLGDSFTKGSGIETFAETYPKIVEKELNKKYGNKFETVIMAKSGYSTLDELKALKETGLKFEPNLVIVGYFLNDAEGKDSRKGYEHMFYFHYTIPYEVGDVLYRHSLFYYFLESRIKNIITNLGFGKNNIDYTKHLYSNSNPYFQQHKKDLEEIIRISNERKIPVLIILIPSLENLKKYPYTEIHTQIKDISESNGAYFLDLLSYFQKYKPDEVRVSLMDAHMNELGHKITSDAIMAYLQEKQLL